MLFYEWKKTSGILFLRGEVDLKKPISIIIIFTILAASLTGGVYKASADVPYRGASSWAAAELDRAVEYGFITEKIKDNMKASITREEFAEIAVKLYEKYTGTAAVYFDNSVFADTGNPEIFKAYNLGIVNGTDIKKRLFSPDLLINREQVAAMMFRAVKAMKPDADFSTAGYVSFADEKDVSDWALESVRFMSKNDFLKGADGKISPGGTCTREMAVLIAARIYEKYSSEIGGNVPDNVEQAGESGNEVYNWMQIVINDVEIFQNDFRIKDKDGSDYIFISAEKFKYAFKLPYVGYYTYPEVFITESSISASWKDEEGTVVMKADMQEGNAEALVNGVKVDAGMAPYSENGKLFVPINFFIALMEMNVEASIDGEILFVQYKNDFPLEILAGTWSDVDTDLFSSFADIATGAISLSSFATAYIFNNDGTYAMRMASVGGFNDTFIAQMGKYKVMGSTVICYDIIETLYKGKPFQLIYENKTLDKRQYGFLGNYDAKEDKIEIGGMWLSRKK